jgi:hypothetical protein
MLWISHCTNYVGYAIMRHEPLRKGTNIKTKRRYTKMYTLKSIARRGTPLAAVFAIVAATLMPAAAAFADSLNPLTERSLMLSSSAPGFTDTDGSGNSEGAPNAIGENYAPAGSGPNGKKTGETFSFKVSTDNSQPGKAIKAFTLQYCTGAAGKCQAPGDNDKMTPSTLGDFRNGVYDSSTNPTGRPTNAQAHPQGNSDLDIVGSWTEGAGAGQFQVLVDGVADTSGWTMAAINAEDTAHSGHLTGKNNLIRLTTAGTGAVPVNGHEVKIVFKPSTSNYITNPGSGSFFVKINTYDTATVGSLIPATPAATNTHIIDGGVTVANVMTDSIHITTKVLETMAFSVGTRNRDTVTLNCAVPADPASAAAGCEAVSGAHHGTCDAVQNVNSNRLNLGNPDAEYSLETGKAWDVNSYWRLSSNSSGGATVYYSGNTLANTVGDEISDVPSESISTPGTEQFGLGFIAPEAGSAEFTAEHPGITPTSAPFVTLAGQSGAGFPVGQTMSAAYDEAAGTLDDGSGHAGTAKFKFLKSSLTTPEPIAQQNSVVVSCATAKMRYVGNIAADTPAGVYTTKINYLAAPQY